MVTFEQLMQGFGVVTVMDACIYKLKPEKTYVGRGSCIHGDNNAGAFKPDDFVCTGLYLDTLKIANLTQEGPTKTITGGKYSNPIIKYGKTMTLEMTDALGRGAVLEEFFGCERRGNNLYVTNRFPGPFAIEGKTFFIDQNTGRQVPVYIFIPQFLPDGILTLTQDADGDAAVFNLNGGVSVTTIRTDTKPISGEWDNDTEENTIDIFYSIQKDSWFHPNNTSGGTEIAKASTEGMSDYHTGTSTKLSTPSITVSGAVASWTPVDNAAGYKIEKTDLNGTSYTYQTASPYTATADCKIRVQALSGSTSYSDSDWSDQQTVNA